MPALPRPDLPPGPQRELVAALHDLHHRAGWPSLRFLARAAGCSHTTVSAVFSSDRLPTWGVLELLVEAMGGDTSEFHEHWLRASSPDGTRAPAPPGSPTIAGRRRELAAVRRHLETGSGLLLVTGEAGIGKTRLVGTAAARAEEVYVASGASLPLSREVPLLPFADVLRAVHGADGGRWLADALSGAARYIPGSLRRLLPEVETEGDVRPDPDDEWSRQRLFTAVGTTLTALAAIRPLAVLLEDLHWADAATLDLLEQLTTRGQPVPVLATYRLDDPATAAATSDWFVRIRRLPEVTTLALAPLTRDETADQLGLLAPGPLLPEFVDLIYAKSLGQPLFTEQLAAHVDADIQLPSLLTDLLEQRLDVLDEQETALVQALAIADRPLTDGILGKATGLGGAVLTSGLRGLDRRRLLAAPDTPHDVRLRHPLLAEAIRRRLVAGEAVDLHARLASVLAEAPGSEPAEVAAHWQAAEQPERELAWRVHAARAAAARFAKGQEAEQWLRVVALWPEEQLALQEPRVRLCDVYASVIAAIHSTGAAQDATALVDGALALVPRLADGDAARVLRIAGDNRGAVDGPVPALALLEQAIALHEGLPPSTDQALALERRAGMLRALGRYADAAASVAAAVDIAEAIGDQKNRRWLLAVLAWHDQMEGRPDLARARAAEALGIRPETPDPGNDIFLAVCVTDLLLTAEAGAEEIEAAGRRGLASAQEWDIASYPAQLLRSNIAEGLSRAGLVERSALLVDPVTDSPPANNNWPVHIERFGVDARRGHLGAARTRIQQLSGLGINHLPNLTSFVEYAAAVDRWSGRPEEAWGRCVALLEQIGPTDASQTTGPVLVHAAAAAADLVVDMPSRADELTSALRDLHAHQSVDPFAPDAVPGNRFAARATWAAELARVARAPTIELWVAAAAEWDKLTRPHDAAYCRWRGAEVAQRAGQATLADKLLKRAAREAREHVPLSEAITRSAAYSRPREHS